MLSFRREYQVWDQLDLMFENEVEGFGKTRSVDNDVDMSVPESVGG
jgi:hypothetical protein